MANFIELPRLEAFLNLEYVTLVIEQDDGSPEVNIVDQENTQLVEGDDAKNLLSCLNTEIKGRRRILRRSRRLCRSGCWLHLSALRPKTFKKAIRDRKFLACQQALPTMPVVARISKW